MEYARTKHIYIHIYRQFSVYTSVGRAQRAPMKNRNRTGVGLAHARPNHLWSYVYSVCLNLTRQSRAAYGQK